jgi:regulator of cell morphogenesis and NO signaling
MRVHGNTHPELKRIYELVEATANELLPHMAKEEQILFPYIKELAAHQNNNTKLPSSRFGTIQNPIHMMEQEHDMVGNYLHEVRALANNYQLPEDACASYSLLYRLLDEFEEDLHIHIHLENNILFPKANTLEQKLLG